jgi:hypothetical protein
MSKRRISVVVLAVGLATSANFALLINTINMPLHGGYYQCKENEKCRDTSECWASILSECLDYCEAMESECSIGYPRPAYPDPYCAESFGDCVCCSNWTIRCDNLLEYNQFCCEWSDSCVFWPNK